MSNNGGVSGEHLRSFVERIERLNEEKAAISEDLKEVYAEVKSVGFDVKILRKAIKRRAMSESDRQEMDALLDVYEHAINFDSTPLGKAADDYEAANDSVDKTVDDLAKKGITVTVNGNSDVAKAVKKVSEKIEKTKADLEYDEALELVTSCNKVSCAFLQRQMKIGYNKAASIIEKLEENNIITQPDHAGQRQLILKEAAE